MSATRKIQRAQVRNVPGLLEKKAEFFDALKQFEMYRALAAQAQEKCQKIGQEVAQMEAECSPPTTT